MAFHRLDSSVNVTDCVYETTTLQQTTGGKRAAESVTAPNDTFHSSPPPKCPPLPPFQALQALNCLD